MSSLHYRTMFRCRVLLLAAALLAFLAGCAPKVLSPPPPPWQPALQAVLSQAMASLCPSGGAVPQVPIALGTRSGLAEAAVTAASLLPLVQEVASSVGDWGLTWDAERLRAASVLETLALDLDAILDDYALAEETPLVPMPEALAWLQAACLRGRA